MSVTYPHWSGGDVPGFPVGPRSLRQNSFDRPQLPHTLQQAFKGHGFILVNVFLSRKLLRGGLLPGLTGPHTALGIGAGIGGSPLLTHFQPVSMIEEHCSWGMTNSQCSDMHSI